MNSPDIDELLSAYIDGLASPEDTARIEADPALLARASGLRRAAQAVAEPVTAPAPGVVDAAVNTALGQSATSPAVISLAARRKRPERRLLTIAAAAAVVAVIFLAGAIVLASNDGDDQVDDLAATLDAADVDDSATGAIESESSSESRGTEDSLADSDAGTTALESEAPAALESEETDDGGTLEGEPLPEAGGEAADAAADQPAADEQGAAGDESAAESAENAGDDTAEETAAESERFGAPPQEFAGIDELLDALEADALEPVPATPPLECGIDVPAQRPDVASVVAFATLPEGPVMVTGWHSPGSFEVDNLVAISTCIALPVTPR